MAMCKLVVGCFGLLMLIAADADVPQFLETMDKYESLWHEEKYDRLYRYIDVFAGENPKYIPAQLFLAWREEQFGCQYEAEANGLRGLTNQMWAILCEVNPELFSRLGKMADDAERMGRLCNEVGKDLEYRRRNYDPRRKRSKAQYLQRCYGDIPFLVPDVSFEYIEIHCSLENRRRIGLQKSPLEKDDLGKLLCDDKISYKRKKSFMDDYLFGIIGTEGRSGMVSKFGDEVIQLNGYCALEMLKQNAMESKRILEDYVLRTDQSIGADKAKRMAVWALLQFDHDDPEITAFLRQLPPKIGEGQYMTREYAKMAVKHLDEGCLRHFLNYGEGLHKNDGNPRCNKSEKGFLGSGPNGGVGVVEVRQAKLGMDY